MGSTSTRHQSRIRFGRSKQIRNRKNIGLRHHRTQYDQHAEQRRAGESLSLSCNFCDHLHVHLGLVIVPRPQPKLLLCIQFVIGPFWALIERFSPARYAHVIWGILAHNIAIKKLFEPLVLMPSQGKLFKDIPWFCVLFMYLELIFVKSLPWPLDVYGSKLSFYYNIVCKNNVYDVGHNKTRVH